MEILQQVIQQFRLNVLSINSVPESYSSTVYKLILNNQQQVFVKIPYSKTKLMREYEFLLILQDKLNTPRVLDFWEGNDVIPGALLLEAIDGEISTKIIDKALAYEIGVSHAKLHSIPATFFKKVKLLKDISQKNGEHSFNKNLSTFQSMQRRFYQRFI